MTTKRTSLVRLTIPVLATLLTLAFSTISAKTIAVVGNVSDTLAKAPNSEIDTTAGEGTVYFLVEEMPKYSYKGENELQSFRNYVTDNLQWSENMDGIQGRVFVSFIVEVDGRISTIRIVRSLDINCDKEAIRVIAHAPKWIPGMQSGKPVRVAYTIPVTFQLQ